MTGRQREIAIRALGVAKLACGVTALAEGVGITAPAVSQWEVVPANRVLDVERLSGVSRHHLRPDIYPEDAKGEQSSG